MIAGRRLLVCAPLVSATLVGCLLRPAGRSNGNTPGDANGTSDATPDAGTSDATGMPDASEPGDAAPPDGMSTVDAGSTTTSCAAGYTQLSCSCTSATTNSDGSHKIGDGGDCTCSATAPFTEAYTHVDGTAGPGFTVTLMLAYGSGSDGLKNVVGTDVQFLSMGTVNGDTQTTAMSMDFGLTVRTQNIEGYYATGSSPDPTVGKTGWALVGSASATAAFPAMVIVSVVGNNGLPPGLPVNGSVTVSAICVQ